jgi:hypothetical protein
MRWRVVVVFESVWWRWLYKELRRESTPKRIPAYGQSNIVMLVLGYTHICNTFIGHAYDCPQETLCWLEFDTKDQRRSLLIGQQRSSLAALAATSAQCCAS